MLLAIVVTVFAVVTDAGRGAQAAATEVQMDTYRADNSSPIVATGPVLDNGRHYTITITGTYSYWPTGDWQNQGACSGSTADAMPMFPSPGTTNGMVGQDAGWHFATPKIYDCSGTFPHISHPIGISMDGGAASVALVVDDPGTAPNPNHTYHDEVIGQGQAVVFSVDDSKTVDNYGIVKFTIEPAPLIWGDNGCSDEIGAEDALPTLLHEAEVTAPVAGLAAPTGGCPNVGETLHTASFGDRIWGDLDCSGHFDAPDVLLILRQVANLPPANLQDCPALGIQIALQG